MEVVECNSEQPDVGCLEVGVDISPSCRVMMDDRMLSAQGNLVADNLERYNKQVALMHFNIFHFQRLVLCSVLLGSYGVRLEDLCLIRGKYCWAVQIDFLVR